MKFSDVKFSKEKRTIFADFPGTDEINHSNLKIQFHITGKYGNWSVKSGLLNVQTDNLLTLKAAIDWSKAQIATLFDDRLSNIEVWRNSGGFLCVGGTYEGYYFYTTKQPGSTDWYCRAEKAGSSINTGPEKRAKDAIATPILNIVAMRPEFNGKGDSLVAEIEESKPIEVQAIPAVDCPPEPSFADLDLSFLADIIDATESTPETPATDNEIEREYKLLHAAERLALSELQECTLGFSPADELRYEKALEKYEAAKEALYWADQRRMLLQSVKQAIGE